VSWGVADESDVRCDFGHWCHWCRRRSQQEEEEEEEEEEPCYHQQVSATNFEHSLDYWMQFSLDYWMQFCEQMQLVTGK
jgi:hypothetical protein